MLDRKAAIKSARGCPEGRSPSRQVAAVAVFGLPDGDAIGPRDECGIDLVPAPFGELFPTRRRLCALLRVAIDPKFINHVFAL